VENGEFEERNSQDIGNTFSSRHGLHYYQLKA